MSVSTTAALPCALYSRVSTEDQAQAFGLAAQQHELRDLARRRRYPIVDEFADERIRQHARPAGAHTPA